jgi:glycosyltransferase involved in cell wall biosynthesis
MHKRALFVHYRTGERDGVSLEIEKRAKVAQDLGVDVSYLTGFDGLHRAEAFVIPEMDIMSPEATDLRLELFEYGNVSEADMLKKYHALEERIMQRILAVIEKTQPHTIFVHNMLALAYNLPASTALLRVLDMVRIPTIVVHHDFWFEREKFAHPQYTFLHHILANLPPKRDYIVDHFVINSIAQKALQQRTGIQATRIGDYFDYSKPLPIVDDFNKTLPTDLGIKENDLVVLQATRIVQRKAIENAIHFVHALEQKLKTQTPVRIHNKLFSKNNRVVLLLTNFVEADEEKYVAKLNSLAKRLNVTLIWAGDRFHNERKINGKKTYSFWDGYLFADVVTYPSTWEGFGNQFLEAIFFQKLPIVFEYPVFVNDIKHEGYEYISLGKDVVQKDGLAIVPRATIEKAVEETIEMLQEDQRLTDLLKQNTYIAQKHHDETLLRKDFRRLLNSPISTTKPDTD